MTQPEALRLADELEAMFGKTDIDERVCKELRRLHEENQALREALAQTEQEPVMWMNKKSAFMCGKADESGVAFHIITTSKQTKHHTVPLYTAPPKREWVGLEDEDVATVKNEFNRGALWAEAKLKEKNA